jgi:hypothetical protein
MVMVTLLNTKFFCGSIYEQQAQLEWHCCHNSFTLQTPNHANAARNTAVLEHSLKPNVQVAPGLANV